MRTEDGRDLDAVLEVLESERNRYRQVLEAVAVFLGDVYAREGEPQDKLLAIRVKVSAALHDVGPLSVTPPDQAVPEEREEL